VLLFGEDAAVKLSPSISIDRLAEIRQDVAELKMTVKSLSEALDPNVRDEVQQFKDTVKFTYSKLEDEIDDLRQAIESKS
jgi:cell division septum initiation protein DivIVA